MKRIVSLILALVIVMSLAPVAFAATEIYSSVTPADGTGTAALRVLPGDSYPVVLDVAKDSKIKVVYKGTIWHKVQVVSGGKVGWMRDEDITMGNRGISAVDIKSRTERYAYINVNNNDYASLRWGPETYYYEIAQLRNGTPLWTFESVGSWYRVRTMDGRIGYVHNSLIKTTKDLIVIPENTYGYVQVSGGSARFYTSLPAGNNTQKSLRSGDVVKVLAKENSYYYIETNDGRLGYIHYDLISMGGVNSPRYNTNLYYDASTYSGVIRQTAAGEMLKVLATDGYFSHVEYGEHVGYILNSDMVY